jgi:hypothetical protein
MSISHSHNLRHPELVSGSISPQKPLAEIAEWMLKQVQHDEIFFIKGSQT